MDLGTIFGAIGALVGICGVAGTVFTFWVKWGKINQRIDDQAGELDALRKDVDQVQATASEFKSLALAVEHMGDKFTTATENLTDKFTAELRHLGELFGHSTNAINGRVDDLKADIQHIRADRTITETPRTRRAG